MTDHIPQWTKWASWLYYPEEGKQLCLRHLKGRTWQGAQQEAEKIAIRKQHQELKVQGVSAETFTISNENQEESISALNGNGIEI